jgi:hypothetical protein
MNPFLPISDIKVNHDDETWGINLSVGFRN